MYKIKLYKFKTWIYRLKGQVRDGDGRGRIKPKVNRWQRCQVTYTCPTFLWTQTTKESAFRYSSVLCMRKAYLIRTTSIIIVIVVVAIIVISPKPMQGVHMHTRTRVCVGLPTGIVISTRTLSSTCTDLRL